MARRGGPPATPSSKCLAPTKNSSEDSGWEVEGLPQKLTLKNINQSKAVHFPLHATYSSGWVSWQAFRELVQNWRDAIIHSFDLKKDQFHVIRKDRSAGSKNEILFHVPDPSSEGESDSTIPLGYIRFTGEHGYGKIEIVNRTSCLEPYHLNIGATTKRNVSMQAGAHGEGLKIALLVLQRRYYNHMIRLVCGGFRWVFDFNSDGNLCARLWRLSESQRQEIQKKAQEIADKDLIPFVPSLDEDVCFVIGEKDRGRDQDGQTTTRDPVSVKEFNDFCKSALFLFDSAEKEPEIIQTTSGDLLLEEKLRGSLFLKGLLLKQSTGWDSASMTGKPLKFGYNFYKRETNRERVAVRRSGEETMAIFEIWDLALEEKPDLDENLHEMLMKQGYQSWADVDKTEVHMRVGTAVRLKEYLFSQKQKWYYCAENQAVESSTVLETIIHGLGCEGVQLPTSYWEVLRNFRLVRTAHEEQERRFLTSDPVAFPSGPFSKTFQHLLRACVQGHPGMCDSNLELVKAGDIALHSAYTIDGNLEDLFKIHEKILDKSYLIHILGLSSQLQDSDVILHGVSALFSSLLQNLKTKTSERERALRVATQRMYEHTQLTRGLSLGVLSSNPTDLMLTWNANSSLLPSSLLNIQLHDASTCSKLREKVMARNLNQNYLPCLGMHRNKASETQKARCVVKSCQAGDGRVNFAGLSSGSEYFAIIIKSGDHDFIPVFSYNFTVQLEPKAKAECRASSTSISSQDKFRLVKKISDLNILKAREWWEGKNTHNAEQKVVIGLEQEGPRGKKRSREEDSDVREQIVVG